MNSLIIRKATLEDAAAMAQLLQVFNEETLDPDGAAKRMKAIAGLETIFLAFAGETAIGFCSTRVVPFLSDRRQGIAKRLMECAEALATAQAFYRSIGFGDYALALSKNLT